MLKPILCAAAVTAALTLSACGTAPTEAEKPETETMEQTTEDTEETETLDYDTYHYDPNGLDPAETKTLEQYAPAYFDFGTKVLSATKTNTNVLFSPVSLSRPLGLTMNGAEGTTKEEMENVIGIDQDALNETSKSLGTLWKNTDVMSVADALWLKEGLGLNPEFERIASNYYSGNLQMTPFDDSTVAQINQWADENTKGMIKEIIDQAPNSESDMIITDAVAFDDKWASPYEKDEIQKEADFTMQDGTIKKVDLMKETSGARYIEGDNWTGFVKSYDEGTFDFVALLPNDKSQDVKEFLTSLKGEDVTKAIDTYGDYILTDALPEFSFTRDMNLAGPLQKLGMKRVFTDNADLTGLILDAKDQKRPNRISDVIQKTFIEVTPEGTKAAAVTMETLELSSAAVIDSPEPEHKEVICDRPFAYLIVDHSTNVPVFMGTFGNPA